jgi:hypothetical protein
MTPAGLELCLHAIEARERERSALEKTWQLRLERARQDVDRAFRQYDAVEPENRMVARTLERAWEEKLQTHRQLQEDHDRFSQTQPARLSAADRMQIEGLAKNLPALWNSPHTSILDQRHVMHLLLERVLVWPSAATLKVHLRWVGGVTTEHEVPRPVKGWRQLPELNELFKQIRRARELGRRSGEIAEDLNAQGQRTPGGQPFTAATIRQLLSRSSKQKKRKYRGRPQSR